MQNEQDKRLDIPAEANREKHINFLDAEERTASQNVSDDKRSGSTKEDEDRRKQWEQGLNEGREAAQKNDD